MDYKTADRLVELRKKNGYSQEELAEKLNVSRQAISNWERAEALPDTENLIALAKLYKISIDELVHGNNSTMNQKISNSAFQGTNMKPVRSTFRITNIISMIAGSALLGVGTILFGLSFIFENNDATLALRITSAALAFSGLVEIIIGISFRAATKKESNRLAHLKATGLKFQATSIEIKRTAAFRTGRHTSARLECSYTNHQGKSCLVKSKSFLTDKNVTHNAAIYVNPQDPTDYAVEIFSTGHAHNTFDHDYR